MSHFTVTVVAKDEMELEQRMAHYDENMSVEPYVRWSREIAAQELEKELAKLRQITAERDAEKYDLEYCDKRLAELEATTAEAYYQDRIGDYEGDMLRDGAGYSTYNLKSEWDWYEIGGRAHNAVLPGNRGKVGAYLRGLESGKRPATFALVTSDGAWHERGNMGWWGMVSDEKDQDAWKTEMIALLKKENPEANVFIVDAHI